MPRGPLFDRPNVVVVVVLSVRCPRVRYPLVYVRSQHYAAIAPYFNMTFGGTGGVCMSPRSVGRSVTVFRPGCDTTTIHTYACCEKWWCMYGVCCRISGGGMYEMRPAVGRCMVYIIYHSGVLCRKQAVSIRPAPQASQNNSIRSLSLRDLALLRATFRG